MARRYRAAEPLGNDRQGKPVYLKDIWPTQSEIQETILNSVHTEMFKSEYGEVFEGDEHLWSDLIRAISRAAVTGLVDPKRIPDDPSVN